MSSGKRRMGGQPDLGAWSRVLLGWVVAGGLLAGYPSVSLADAEEDYKRGLELFQGSDQMGAMTEFRKASSSGHLDAMAMLGFMLDIAEEDAEAVKWYRSAAERNHAGAQYGLGSMYAKGEGVPKSSEEARGWYIKAAEQGDGQAMLALAKVYRNGEIGEKVDHAKALMWYHKAVDINYAQAILELVDAYRKGKMGLTPNPAEADRLEKLLPASPASKDGGKASGSKAKR